jgi:transposase-like protein
MREVVRYSEAFKLRLVENVANGKYKSLDEASRRNGLRGGSTLSKWIKQYGWEDMLPKRIKVETMNEIDELQAAHANAHMDYCLESAFLDIACKHLGVSSDCKSTTFPLLNVTSRLSRLNHQI